MKNRNYSVDELIRNPSFQRLVKGEAAPGEVDQWTAWMEQSEENRKKIKKALSGILGFEPVESPAPDFEEEWSRLYRSTIGKSMDKQVVGTADKDSTLRWIYRAAAAILLMGLVGLGIYNYSENDKSATQLEQISERKTIITVDGEEKLLKFSNGSKVTLNSNSTLTYTVGLLHDETIDITLEGEAYFDADPNHSKARPAFAVTTPDGVIKDIGTKFLVTVEKDRSRVVLQEGRVEVEARDEKNIKEKFEVTKGEMVEFSKSAVLKKELVNSTFYTSWATGVMEFEQTEISKFATYVAQRFNVDVQFFDPKLADITLDGAIYFNSLEGLVRAVSDVAKIPVYQSGDRKTVYIGNPNNGNNTPNK